MCSQKFTLRHVDFNSFRSIRWRVCLWAGLLFWSVVSQNVQAEYQQLDIAADVKSRFSTGCSSVQELMTQAEFKGLDGILFGDHDHKSVQYGIPFLERIFKFKISRPSVLDNGAAPYLSEINQIDRTDETVVLIPGVESAPFYHWTGKPWNQNLVAHNWDKHLLVVGLPDSTAYEEIPSLNGGLTARHWKDDYLLFSVLCGIALIGLLSFLSRRWRFRGTSFMITVVMALLAANNHPFKSSPYDQYQGDLGVQPYQYLIDYADSRGALVFWSHLETPKITKMTNGWISVLLKTQPHPQDLLLTHNYTGFQALDETPVSAVEPGKEWDRALMMYLGGERDRPVWGYGANDFHCEGKTRLGGVRTVVLAEQKNRKAVVEAMAAGRMYAVKLKEEKNRLSLDRFELVDTVTDDRAVMGEGLKTGKPPLINIQISMTGGRSALAKITLVRNGRVIKKGVLTLPFNDLWRDETLKLSEPAYYRLLIETDPDNQLVSNPIFLNSGPQRNSLIASGKKSRQPEEVPKPAIFPRRHKPPLPPTTEKTAEAETPPSRPAPEKAEEAETPPSGPVEQFVEVTGNQVRLRKGPSVQFPVAGYANKGDRLQLVRRTEMVYQGKVWMVVLKEGQQVYIWGGLVKETD